MNEIKSDEPLIKLEDYTYDQLYDLLETNLEYYSNVFKTLQVKDIVTPIVDFKLWNETFPNAIGLKCNKNISSIDILFIINNKNLQSLYLNECRNLLDKDMEYLCNNLKKLKTLNIEWCQKLSDNSIDSICKKLTNLEYLYMKYTDFTSRGIINVINKLSNLKTLDISCNSIFDNIEKELINKSIEIINIKDMRYQSILWTPILRSLNNLENLKSINLSFNNLTDEDLTMLSNKNLVSLNISNCGKMTNYCINHICNNFKNLKVLNISNNNILKNKFIKLISENLKNLTSLYINNNTNVNFDSIKYICDNLKNLTELELGKCDKLIDESIKYICDNLKNLTSLNISNCSKLTDESIKYICDNLKNLTNLNICSLNCLNDENISLISENLKNLICLYMSYNNLNDKSYLMISKNLTKIEHLSIANNNISLKSLMILIENLKDLQFLDCSNCKSIDNLTFIKICYYCKKLNFLNIGASKINTDNIKQLKETNILPTYFFNEYSF